MNKVLLVAYKFPPFGGVGGFRWSKLAKHLARQGNLVYVIAYDWPEGAANSLVDDVQHENIKINRVASFYPHRLKSMRLPGRILRVLRKYYFRFVDKVIFFDDEAQYWGWHLLPAVNALIEKEKINVIVATGHPFQANYWASVVKTRNPGLRLVQDLRDPWLLPARYGGRGWRYAVIQRRMQQALSVADTIVTVTEGLRDVYQRACPTGDVRVVYNGFDPDICKLGRPERPVRREIVLSHIGNISNNRDLVCDLLFSAIQKLIETRSIKLRFAGSVPASIHKKYRRLFDAGVIDYLGVLSQKEALDVVADSDFALQFNADISPVPLSTKIYEYAALKIPVISLNYGGEIDHLIKRHSLGYSINVKEEDVLSRLSRIFSSPVNFAFDVKEFSYDLLASQYASILWPGTRTDESSHGDGPQ
ncbi:glycosyltransferase [Bordetella petrii]|uniref:Glycosyltransferase subfamily 4-like N-terminal domain-containing protein n=1 Tax=Bordetella petrii (strain ATCC BAA-461 / DSM 12804 / CCUG 43448 / CIP 107267 / Se-1111R) TaxID=340100 RepID=A9IHC1_BORPD|nr:glycosyltransferase [Bordetella petrii]CAP45185.1 hypothetical protein predicted by Glimmer/Critica [Bordetella petrii]